ncbi:hypothetical protein [uncultured Microbacterium sp.]|uniref:hypothetical protein n=1 Tax=uncultured Microbacterium sp. TaxID=191216 RepID=UPI0028D4A049|nr:hypothetical protein [uncultured Microbacterium sp.]
MTGPWFLFPFGVALAAYALVQLGPNPHWWDIATAVILFGAAITSISRGVLDVRANRRGRPDRHH